MTRGFWDGMITGGLLGAALTAIYMSQGQQDKRVKRVMGRIKQAKEMVEELGNEVAEAWKS